MDILRETHPRETTVNRKFCLLCYSGNNALPYGLCAAVMVIFGQFWATFFVMCEDC